MPNLFITLILLLHIVSCDSDGNGVSDKEEPPTNINSKVSGKIFLGHRINGGWVLDISTGHYTRISGINWEENNPNYPGLASFSAYPLQYSGAEYVETVSNCKVAFGNNKDCIVFHEADGTITSNFELPNLTFGAAKLAYNKLYVAISMENENRKINDPFKILNIYNRSGKLVNTIDSHDIDDQNFVWTPDDRIVYTSEQSIYVSDLPKPIITFPEMQGIPGEPSISPDGNKIVFTLGEDTSKGVVGTIWMINIDGTELRQLTIGDTDLSISPSHKTAIWSPDGKWIFMIDRTSIEGNAYIIPSNAEKVEITQKRETKAIPFFSYYLEIFSEGTDPIKLSTTFGAYGNISWLP